MKRFVNDLKKYKNYIIYATWAELKTEVINSYLGFLWMILEPLAFMLIYTFIANVVFRSHVQYFPVFVFIGLSIWNFFNKMVTCSVKLVSSNRDTVTKVYIPKFDMVFTAEDCGSAIKGKRIDIFMNSEAECVKFGRQNMEIKILK